MRWDRIGIAAVLLIAAVVLMSAAAPPVRAQEKEEAAKAEAKARAVLGRILQRKPPPPPADPPAAEKKDVAPPDANEKKKEDETKEDEDDVEPEEPEEPVDPELVRVYLRDGSVITGKFSIDSIDVDTEFGNLTIPITEMSSFRPGLESFPEFLQEIQSHIAKLDAEDFKLREQAQQALVKLGPAIRPLVQAAIDGKSAERDRRLKKIQELLEEEAGSDVFSDATDPQWIRDDTIHTTHFNLVGKIHPREFTVTSRWGTLKMTLSDIRSVRRDIGGSRKPERKSLTLTGQHLAQLKYKGTGIRVQKGDRIRVQAEGSLSRNGSSSYRSGPDGSTRFGYFSQSPQILGGTLVARIGGQSKVLKMGSNGKVIAPSSGHLQFAVGMRPDYVGRYQFIGQYNVKVNVEPGD